MEEQKPEPKANGKRKREEKIRKRDVLSLENVLKSLTNYVETERFQMLQEKYEQLYEEHRAQQNNTASVEKRIAILQREKDQLTSENRKSILARTRLESLCRELQKQNKMIKDENIAKIREEEELRKDVVAKFQSTLTELTNVLQENSDKNLKLRDDNMDMANKISSLCKEFETGQEELARMSKQMGLEKQLFEATIAKLQYEHLVEREQWLKDREVLENNLQKSEANVKALEGHLEMYTGKYAEFETTISKSNEVFDNCKSEMVKMTKQISVLEKELKMWKARWEMNAKAVIELTSTNHNHEVEIAANERKIDQLQRLCRQLQVDRAAYIKLLKSNGIEPTSQICVDSTPVVTTTTGSKSTKKEQELAKLKTNLKALQDQFVGLTIGVNETAAAEEQKPDTVAPTVTPATATQDSIVDPARTAEKPVGEETAAASEPPKPAATSSSEPAPEPASEKPQANASPVETKTD